LELNENVVIVNVAVVEPAGTVATRGTAVFESVVLRATIAPPEGAGAEREIVHVLVALGKIVDGLHCMEEIAVTAERVRFALCDAPL
jgi:hypothetical protein